MLRVVRLVSAPASKCHLREMKLATSFGFWVFAMLIIINRHQADLIGFSAGSSIALVGGSSTILVGVCAILGGEKS
jgi:hypothetical protein